jgi:subtilase family serine protease
MPMLVDFSTTSPWTKAAVFLQAFHTRLMALFVLMVSFAILPQILAAAVPEAVSDQGTSVTLRGNLRPEATAMNDRGRVADGLPLPHLILLLKRRPEQEEALQQFLQDIQDPASPLFHHWVTAAEFGQRYGASSGDVARATSWLSTQGFKVNHVYPNQMIIDFTGSAGQVRQTFHTEIHNLQVQGQSHVANMSDPEIPADLASTLAGIVSLNDFRPQKLLKARAEYSTGNGGYPIVPADLWTIYNFSPAFAEGYTGQGQTIVVVEDSDLYSTTDWNTFRSTLGIASAYSAGSLSQVNPRSGGVNNCIDPGVNGNDDEVALDVEWASAAAPNATIMVALIRR